MEEVNKLSVIVPTFNRRFLLPRTIKSLVDQSYKNIEILVVNDGGEDVSDIINNFNDKRIRYFYKKNGGLASARNVALKNISGQVISLLDDDDIYLPYTVEMRMYMMNKIGADIIYSRSLKDIWEKSDGGYVSVSKVLYWHH